MEKRKGFKTKQSTTLLEMKSWDSPVNTEMELLGASQRECCEGLDLRKVRTGSLPLPACSGVAAPKKE